MTYYELSNHLGNVLVTVTDMKIGIDNGGNWTAEYYEATVVSANDYYPFGSAMAGRKYSSGAYRYGFNGMEKDDEVKGEGNSYDFGARLFDSRVGRWLAVDPLAAEYVPISPYAFVANRPTTAIDPDGKRIKVVGTLSFKLRILGYVTVMRIFGDEDLRRITKELIQNERVITINSEASRNRGDLQNPFSPCFSAKSDAIKMWPKVAHHRSMVFPVETKSGKYEFIKEREFSILANEISHAYDYLTLSTEEYQNMMIEDKEMTNMLRYRWSKDIIHQDGSVYPNYEGIEKYEARSNVVENKARAILGLPPLIENSHIASSFDNEKDAEAFINVMTILQKDSITDSEMQKVQDILKNNSVIKKQVEYWRANIPLHEVQDTPESPPEAKPDTGMN